MSIQILLTRRLSVFERFDPGGIVFRLTIRTLIAALIAVVIFHLFHKYYMGVWVGFSAQFVMQTEPGVFFDNYKRLLFVFIVTVVFSLLVFFGSLLADQMVVFSVVLAVIAFLTGYAFSFGKVIYNTAIWALVCFLLMTAVPKEHVAPWMLMLLFFVGGMFALVVLRISLFFPQRGQSSAMFSKTLYQASLWTEALVIENTIQEQEFQNQVKNSLHLQQAQVMFLGTRTYFFKSRGAQSVIDINRAIQRLYPFLIIIGRMKHDVFGRSFLFSNDLDDLLKKIMRNLSVLSERVMGNRKQAWVQLEAGKLQQKVEDERKKILDSSEVPPYDEMLLVSNFFLLYKTFNRRLSEINVLILDSEAE